MTQQQPLSEPKQHPCRCETCEHYIGKMVNFFGCDQPFCKNPKIVEANKNKPETGGMIAPNHYRIEDHKIMKGDLYFQPMSEFQVQTIRILGCFSHSANTGAQARIDAVVKELDKEKVKAYKEITHEFLDQDTYRQGVIWGCDKAIALLKEDRK